MAEVVVDENGNEIDKDGNQKKSMNADSMNKADILKIVGDYNKALMGYAEALRKVLYATDYSAGETAMKQMIATITGGPDLAYAKQNSWLQNKSERANFITGGGVSIGDKQVMADFFDLVEKSAGLRAEMLDILKGCLGGTLYSAYSAIRFELQMTEMVKAEDMMNITRAFAEFDACYIAFNHSSVFDKVHVNKTDYTVEERIEMFLDYFDGEICKKEHLTDFILSSKKTAPEGMNQLYVLDRATKTFDKIYNSEASLKVEIENCIKADELIAALYAACSDELYGYLDGYRAVIEVVGEICQRALKAMNAFLEKKDTAPYSCMHYDALVKDAVNKHMLGTLSDPVTQGTNYCYMAKNMVSKFQNLARNVAKSAPAK